MTKATVQTTVIRKRRLVVPAMAGNSRASGKSADLEETLVRDARAGLRPAELVENKLRGMLKCAGIPVSQMQLSACCGHSRQRGPGSNS